MYPSVVMPPAAYKFRPCHLSSPRRGEGFCGTSTYSLHPSLCANSFISPSAINSSCCDALERLQSFAHMLWRDYKCTYEVIRTMCICDCIFTCICDYTIELGIRVFLHALI